MDPTAKSTDTVTGILLQDVLRHLKATNNEMLLPTNVRGVTGQGNVNKIKISLQVISPNKGFPNHASLLMATVLSLVLL